MVAALYRLIKLAWRHRRLIAFALTVIVGFWERHREKLPERLQKYEPPRSLIKDPSTPPDLPRKP